MNFTREPIIITVITPKDGFKLVIRSSKASGQEEYFVDSLEMISFGNYCFYRSLEKPKCFMLPVSDYEVLEVRETKMILKVPGVERGIKIGGGREAVMKVSREVKEEEVVQQPVESEDKSDKRREKRRFRKRRRGEGESPIEEQEEIRRPSLIPPPNHLISETMRYKELAHPEPESVIVEEEDFEKEDTVERNPDEEVPF